MTIHIAERRFLVIGAGVTGQSVATVLTRQGGRVRLVDRSRAALERIRLPREVDARIGDDGEELLQDIDAVIPSPGVARSHRLLHSARTRGIPIVSEIELASHMLPCPILAVTGTNGKSTTTTLLGEMLRHAGQRVFIGGNLGTPLIEAAMANRPYDAVVVEVSSFQLEWVSTFRPRVAVVLNLTPDHLDRYASIEEYGQAKAALLRAQRSDDFAVLNRDDPWVWDQRRATSAAVISFGHEPVEFGSFIAGDTLIYRGPAPASHQFPLGAARLQGTHNRENMMAAATAAAIWGVSDAAIQDALERTVPLPHRLELVRERAGVRFFDDSKGTNVGAVDKSLASFDDRVILLAGGYDKGSDFAILKSQLRRHVKHLVLFGAAGAKIQEQVQGAAPISRVADLATAVRTAVNCAAAGDTVLLSPGCASFDEFTDYAARGRRFRELVEAL